MISSHHFSAILPISAAIAHATASDILSLLTEAIAQADLTVHATTTATFTPQGVSAVVILAESHVAIHIWPEEQQASIDIHVCDYNRDNYPRAQQLAALLTLRLTGQSSPQLESHWHYLTINA